MAASTVVGAAKSATSDPEDAAMNDFRCANCRIYYGAGKGGNRIIHCDRHSEAHVTALTQSLECGQQDMDYLRGRLEAVEKERDVAQGLCAVASQRFADTQRDLDAALLGLRSQIDISNSLRAELARTEQQLTDRRTQLTTAESELRAAREALEAVLPEIKAAAAASHMMDGFGPIRPTREDSVLALVKAALTPGGTSGGEGNNEA